MVTTWFFMISILIQPFLSSEDGIRSKLSTITKKEASPHMNVAGHVNNAITKEQVTFISTSLVNKTFSNFDESVNNLVSINKSILTIDIVAKNDTSELRMIVMPKNDTLELQTTSKLKNDTFELQTTSKPKNDTFELKTPKSRNDTFELKTSPTQNNHSRSNNESSGNTEIIMITSIRGICFAFGVPPINCTCEKIPQFCQLFELQTTSKRKNDIFELQTNPTQNNQSNSKNERSDNTERIVTSIRGICFAFGVPPINCTCEKLPQFCHWLGGKEEPPKEPVVRYIYNRSDTHWYAALGSTAAIIGIFVNFAVLLVSFVHRKSLARSEQLVALLSFFDCTTCIFQFFGTIYLFKTFRWPYGLAMCKVFRGIDMLGSFVAVEIMLLICVERFVGIMYPFQNVVSMDHLMKALTCIAILIVIGTLVPLLMVVVIDEPSGRCIDTWRGTSKAVIYEWFILVFFFILPVIIIFIGYGVIMRYLHIQSKSHVITTQEMIKQRLKRNRRVMFLLISIVCAFIILTLPNKAIHLYLELESLKDPKTYKILVFIAYVTYPLHSVVNPFIYSLVDKDFRNKLQNLTIRKITSKIPRISVTSRGRESTAESSL